MTSPRGIGEQLDGRGVESVRAIEEGDEDAAVQEDRAGLQWPRPAVDDGVHTLARIGVARCQDPRVPHPRPLLGPPVPNTGGDEPAEKLRQGDALLPGFRLGLPVRILVERDLRALSRTSG